MHRRRRGHRVTWTLLLLAVLGVLVAGLAFWQAGYRPYVVHTGSMVPTYRPGDLVIDRPADALRPGQVITFRHSSDPNDLVTHRITEVTATGEIHTKGDANRTADSWSLRPALVVGTVATAVPKLGYLIVFLQQPTGVAALLVAAVGLYLLWGLFFPPSPTTLRDGASTPAGSQHSPTLLLRTGGFPRVRPSLVDNE